MWFNILVRQKYRVTFIHYESKNLEMSYDHTAQDSVLPFVRPEFCHKSYFLIEYGEYMTETPLDHFHTDGALRFRTMPQMERIQCITK